MTQGPIAVPASNLPKTLRLQTRVNGEKRQDATTDDLIFSVPFLVKTLSAGQTIQLGDVIATGTPAGVGFGQKTSRLLEVWRYCRSLRHWAWHVKEYNRRTFGDQSNSLSSEQLFPYPDEQFEQVMWRCWAYIDKLKTAVLPTCWRSNR